MRIKMGFLVALLLLVAPPLPVLVDGTYCVFDKDGNVTEIWKEKDGVIEVYNPDWSRKGYIKKEGRRLERYDKDWRREEIIRNDLPTSEGDSQP